MVERKRGGLPLVMPNIRAENVPRMHQKLQHFIATSPWHDDAVLARVREEVIPQMQDREPIQAWIIDDSGMPKKGKLSVGVAHQYCGQLGKQASKLSGCRELVDCKFVRKLAPSIPALYAAS